MRKIVIGSPISIEEFESNFEKKTMLKANHSLFTANIFLSKVDKKKRKFVIIKTGKYGVGGGQLYLYGKYRQQKEKTIVVGKFDITGVQKIVAYLMFISTYIVFALRVGWRGTHILIATILYHLILFFGYKLLCALSFRVFKQRGEEAIALLKEILYKDDSIFI